MNKNLHRSMILFLVILNLFTASSYAQTPIWSEEFETTGKPNPEVWTYNVGGSGFGNQELQFYTDRSENSRVVDGSLVIEARRESYSGKAFTSARLNTLGRFAFKYGILEARIKLPNLTKGLWPAFWTMGNAIGIQGWPKCGEMDIMELGSKAALDAGKENSTVGAAMHWFHDANPAGQQTASYGNSTEISGNFYDDFHTFKMDWNASMVSFYVDDIKYHEMAITDANLSEFHNFNFILINMAVGGTYPGILDPSQITAPLPAQMLVDYVRLYDNGSTEIQLAKNTAKVGPFGIWTEETPVNSQLDFGKADLFIWNNMASNGGQPFEGTSALSYTINPNNWYGMGISLREDINLQRFRNGHLRMHMKTNGQDPIDIGFSSSGTNSDGWFSLVGNQYGLVRDNQWHEVIIPMNKFANLDFNTIKAVFMVKGGGPAAAFDLAFDNVYLTENIPLKAPENGHFAVYTDESPYVDNFKLGVDGELYLWENTLAAATQNPFEGNGSLSYTTTGKGWFGLGFTPNQYYNLTAFRQPESKLHFALKTTTTTTFRIGVKSGGVTDVGQKWIEFANGNDPYGFKRDGQWHVIEIPMSEIADVVDLSQVSQLFQVLGLGEATDFEIDDIYYSNGGTAIKDDTTTVPPPPMPDRAPIVRFTNPVANGILSGTANVNVSAFDVNVGNKDGDGIERVTFKLLKGRDVIDSFTDTTAAFSWSLNTNLYPDGHYFLGTTVTTTTEAGDTILSNYIPVSIKNTSDRLPIRVTSQKRGIGYGQHSLADMNAMKSGISWWYNWAAQPEPGVRSTYPNSEVAFMPMVWGGNFDVNQVASQIPAGAKYLLGFNEPNFTEQANLTPQQAAALWPKLEQIAEMKNLEIVGPAMNYCGGCTVPGQHDPIDYLDDFFEACQDCKVDYISVHWYACDRGALEWYLNRFKKYNKPIWVTEIACWEGSPTLEDELRYMKDAVDVMENDTMVYKYAWFQGRSSLLPAINVLGEQGQLTELGYLYATLPFEGMDTVIYEPAKPTVSITTPVNNSSYTAPATIVINANASSTEGTVTKVEFYAGNSLLATDEAAPYSYTWKENMPGNFVLTAKAYTSLNAFKISEPVNVSIVEPVLPNLALKKPVKASSVENGGTPAAYAVDGILNTRWSSAFADPQWIYVDLEDSYSISKVKITWEGALGKDYKIQLSEDTVNWSDIKTVTGNTTLVNEWKGLSGTGRYLRIYGTARGTGYGYSIFELEVYGAAPSSPDADGDGFAADVDCNDANADVYPGAPETCDGIDNNCNSSVDEGVKAVFYADADGDGFGNAADSVQACIAPEGFVNNSEDCNDADASINPDGTDLCDGVDRNCDGEVILPLDAPSIVITPADNTYTGGDPNTIYISYGPQTVTLSVANDSSLSYNWSPSAGLSTTSGFKTALTPTMEGNYEIVVTARNAENCDATDTVSITVIDVRCDKSKVQVCYKGKSVCANKNQVSKYLSDGGKLGSCNSGTVSANIYPNPTTGEITIETTIDLKKAKVSVFSEYGLEMKNVKVNKANKIDVSSLPAGSYVLMISEDRDYIRKHFIKQ